MSARSLAEGRKTLNLSEALNLFLIQKTVDGNAKLTIFSYEKKVGIFIKFVGDLPVTKLTLQHGQQFVLSLQGRHKYEEHPFHKEQEKGLSKATIRSYVRSAKVFTAYLEAQGYIKEDPLRKLRLPKDTKRVVDSLSDDEIKTLYAHIEGGTRTGSRLYLIVTLLLDTGMRAGELAGLTLNDVDYKQSRIKIVNGKGDKQRFVPFGTTSARAMLSWINRFRPDSWSNNLLLNLDGGPMSREAITRAVKRLAMRAGIERLHPHLFRHTFGTSWMVHSDDVFALQKILGHADLETTQIYVDSAQKTVDMKHRQVSPGDRLGVGRQRRK